MGKLNIIEKLNQYFPELTSEVKYYLEDFSEIYLHLIFGDVFNPYLLELLDFPVENRSKINKASELLEYMASQELEIQEVVVVTILERLSDDKEKTKIFESFAGENTREFLIALDY